jgi:hypothetical protein
MKIGPKRKTARGKQNRPVAARMKADPEPKTETQTFDAIQTRKKIDSNE